MWDLLLTFFVGVMAGFGAGAFWAFHGIGKKLKELKVLVGIVAVVVIVFVVFVPIVEVPYTETVQYQDTETYYENELQEVTEPLEYQCLGWGFGGYETLDGNYVSGPHYKLMNRGEVAGHFAIRLVLYTIGKDKYLDLLWEYPNGFPEEVIKSNFQKRVIEEVLYLKVKQKGEVAWSWGELGVDPAKIEYDGRWEILPEEVRRVKPVQVEKERTVTKERPETRYKKVTVFKYILSIFQG